jgi:hypothetical protein
VHLWPQAWFAAPQQFSRRKLTDQCREVNPRQIPKITAAGSPLPPGVSMRIADMHDPHLLIAEVHFVRYRTIWSSRTPKSSVMGAMSGNMPSRRMRRSIKS